MAPAKGPNRVGRRNLLALEQVQLNFGVNEWLSE